MRTRRKGHESCGACRPVIHNDLPWDLHGPVGPTTQRPHLGPDEELHTWGLTGPQRTALRGKHPNQEAARRYTLATFRALGWRPVEAPSVGTLYPHSACDCSVLCRTHRFRRRRPAPIHVQRDRWQQVRMVGTLAAVGWR